MKHTDFWKQMIALKVSAEFELIAALKAHGGEYTWRDPDPDDDEEIEYDEYDDRELPCILVTPDYGTPGNVYVYQISMDDKEKVWIYARREDETGDYIEDFSLEDISINEIDFLIGQIPETETVSDVTEKHHEFEITSVCRDDLEYCGYDAAKVSDEDMKHLASKMSDAYCQNGFWEDLRCLADLYNFPKLEE